MIIALCLLPLLLPLLLPSVLLQFVHKVINEICDKVGLNYEDYFKVLSVSDYSKLQHSLSSAVRIISRDVVKKEQLTEKLRSMGASADVSQVVATCVWVRKEEVRDQLVKESCNIAQSRLDDFDWKLKVNAILVDDLH